MDQHSDAIASSGACERRKIGMKKENAAFICFTLEASEGQVSYSTLPHSPHSLVRELLLTYHPSTRVDVELTLDTVRDLWWVVV